MTTISHGGSTVPGALAWFESLGYTLKASADFAPDGRGDGEGLDTLRRDFRMLGPDGTAQVAARLERETAWLNQEQMAELLGQQRSVVTEHVRNSSNDGEFEPKAVRAKYAETAVDGITDTCDHFNLHVTISLRDSLLRGYTVHRAPRGPTGAASASLSSWSSRDRGRIGWLWGPRWRPLQLTHLSGRQRAEAGTGAQPKAVLSISRLRRLRQAAVLDAEETSRRLGPIVKEAFADPPVVFHSIPMRSL